MTSNNFHHNGSLNISHAAVIKKNEINGVLSIFAITTFTVATFAITMPVVTRSQSSRIEAAQLKLETMRQQFIQDFRDHMSQFIHVKEHESCATNYRESLSYVSGRATLSNRAICTQLATDEQHHVWRIIDMTYCLQLELLTKMYKLACDRLPTLIKSEPTDACWPKFIGILRSKGNEFQIAVRNNIVQTNDTDLLKVVQLEQDLLKQMSQFNETFV